MPEESMYSQREPIGIAGGNPSLYGYVWDSTREVDVNKPFIFRVFAEKDFIRKLIENGYKLFW